jgi:two-component system, NtrC family, response regulator AtoC
VSTPPRVLIVDDDASQRRLIEFWLQEEGYGTTAVGDGISGWRSFEEQSPSLVISDIRMPAMSGLDLLSRIKATNSDVPVILITAFGTVNDAVDAMKLGAADYVLKPLNGDELKVNVRRALERQQLVAENRYLRDLAGSTFRFEYLIGQSRRMREVLDLCTRVAGRDSTVLLTGESGTGKGVLAKAIHQNSLREGKPFVTVNCGALPEALAESELFGHRKGSFTGAVADRQGKFEAANEGTIFLDEIGELPLNLQVKLLRVIQDREVDKIGFSQPVKVNVRILAATNRKLKTQIEDGQFREDLFYRLSVVTIDVPPLRERREDIPMLVSHFLKSFSERYHTSPLTITDEALALILRYAWPGNVRQLENAIERLVVLANGNTIKPEDLPQEVRESESRIAKIDLKLPDEGIDLEQVEKEILSQALQKHAGNQTRAAQYLNISRKTLIYRMEKFGLVPSAIEETERSEGNGS